MTPLLLKHHYRIGEVARIVGEKPHVIRFWEGAFRLNVERSRSQQRIYSADQVRLLAHIKTLLRVLGFTIPGAKKVILMGYTSETLSVMTK